MTNFNITQRKLQKIREERARKENSTAEEVIDLIMHRETTESRQNLVFYTEPTLFAQKLRVVLDHLEREYGNVGEEQRRSFLAFLRNLNLDLRSFLPEWNLKNKTVRESKALTDSDLEK